jgi:hypothetical protein
MTRPITFQLRVAYSKARPRPQLEQLPDARDLNPDEGICNDRKRSELAHRCCPDLSALALALRRAKERLRYQRTVIQTCFRQTGYHV